MEATRETTEKWAPCEYFSPEEYQKYPLAIMTMVLSTMRDGKTRIYSELLDIVIQEFSSFKHFHPFDEKPCKPRNLPMTEYFLNRALYSLEDRADPERKHKRVHFDGQRYSIARDN